MVLPNAHSYGQPRWGNSRTWTNPNVPTVREQRLRNQVRKRLCARSPFWSESLDIKAHNDEVTALVALHHKPTVTPELSPAAELFRKQFNLSAPPPAPPIRAPFSGKTINDTPTFIENFSQVLSQRTVFTPQWRDTKAFIAPWPEKHEMKYEGDDRISTDKLHARFPGAPRVDANKTVNWQHRTVIPQYPLEYYHHRISEVQVWEREHYIEELEPSDEVGKELLGSELFDLLDPVDRF